MRHRSSLFVGPRSDSQIARNARLSEQALFALPSGAMRRRRAAFEEGGSRPGLRAKPIRRLVMATNPLSHSADTHGWIGTETVATRLGDFEFRNGYPTVDAATRLTDALLFSRAVESFLVQMPGVSWYRVWKGIALAGGAAANQMV